jgi:N-formylglutamate deformylase
VDDAWTIERGEGPLVAVVLHAGHELSAEVERLQVLDGPARRREEDPYVDRWAMVAPSRVLVSRSRFEVDFNRPRERAVYLEPSDAWELPVWREPPPEEVLAAARAAHDRFYRAVRALLDDAAARHRRFAVLDLHSYCHRRGGPGALPESPALNPEINVGSVSVDRVAFGPLVHRFVEDLRRFDFDGRALDVRENVRFGGGYFPRWVNREYAGRGCAVTVEVKKTFMDEWTGELDAARFALIGAALASTVPGLLEAL